MDELSRMRAEIDKVDSELLALFQKRMRLAGEIGIYKHENGMRILDPEREREILNDVRAASEPALRPYCSGLYRYLFVLSYDYQRQQILGDGADIV